MRVGYCKVYRSCFRTFGAKVLEIFVLMIRQFHRNESSWNVRSRGTKVPQERMFHGTKVLGTFAPEERKFHRSESSKERMFHGTKSSTGAKVLSMVFSLPGTKVQRNEKAWNPIRTSSNPYLPSESNVNDKCRSVSYGRRLEFSNTYTISDNVIAKVDKVKDLGVTFDSRLKFDEHTDIKNDTCCASCSLRLAHSILADYPAPRIDTSHRTSHFTTSQTRTLHLALYPRPRFR